MAEQRAHSPFRKDINGLRAIAVLLVIAYHFGVRHFEGGFVGVDEFFVISGFLMTKIVCKRVAIDQFSFADFYASRARRIVPALLVLTSSVLIFGYFYLDSVDYLILGKHAASSLTFTSNLLYDHEAGYFDSASLDKWLLHTWSLSVEWQFYVLFPLFLVAALRFRSGSWVVHCVFLALAVSLLLCVLLTPGNQAFAFFSLPSRGWELFAGSMCYFYLNRFSPAPKPMRVIGYGLVILPALLYSARVAYPGYFAIAPVAGTGLVIVSTGSDAVLGARPVQFLGDISYSLYLWHWPLLLAARYFGLQLSVSNLGLLVAVSIGIAYASSVLVEAPFRKGPATSRQFLLGTAVALGSMTALAGFVWQQRGVPSRLSKEAIVAADEGLDRNPRQAECFIESTFAVLPECRIGVRSLKPSVALWGDSHGLAILSAVSEGLTQLERSGVFYGMSGCPPLLGVSGFDGRPQCPEFNKRSAAKIFENDAIRDVVVVSRWSDHATSPTVDEFEFPATALNGLSMPALSGGALSYFRRIRDTLCILRASGKTVFALAPIPEMSVNVPKSLARSILTRRGNKKIVLDMVDYEKRHGPVLFALRAAERECGVRIIYPTDVLCRNGECPAVQGGRPMYIDTNHLSEFGNRPLIPLLVEALESTPDVGRAAGVDAVLERGIEH